MQDTAGEARTNSSVMYSYGPPHMAKQTQDEQLEHTYSSYVRIRDVAQKTCQKRWMIGRSGDRGSGISVQAARHDDDESPWWKFIKTETLTFHYNEFITFGLLCFSISYTYRYKPYITQSMFLSDKTHLSKFSQRNILRAEPISISKLNHTDSFTKKWTDEVIFSLLS